MSRRLLACLLLVSGLALAGCSSPESSEDGGAGGDGDPEVQIHGNAFDPSTITVARGQHVHFTNHDGVTHTATSDTGAFDTGDIAGGGTKEAHFDTAGSFPYHCSRHPGMKGTVVVT